MPSPVDQPPAPYGRLLFALCFAGVVAGAMPAVVVPVLPNIAQQLNVSVSTANWSVTAGLLMSAVTVPVFGRLADLRGGRRVLLWCLAVLTAGAVLSALAPSIWLLMLGRTLQGATGAVFPLAITVLYREVAGERRTSAMALMSGTLAVGGGLGPVIAGVLNRVEPDYRVLFWLCAALGTVSLLLVVLFVPRREAAVGTGRVDVTGATLLGTALVLVMLPLSQGTAWGWTSAPVVAMAVGAVVTFRLFLRAENRHRDPLLDTELLRRRPIMIANLVSALVGAAMYLSSLVLSHLVRSAPESSGYGFGASALTTASVYLLPCAVAAVLAAPVGGRLVVRFGSRATLVVSGLTGIVGFAVLALAHDRPWQVVASSFTIGVMVSLGYAALPALLAQFVPPSRVGMANSANALTRWVGGAAGSSLVAAVLAAFTPEGGGTPGESALVVLAATGAVMAAAVVLLARFGLSVPGAAGPPGRRGSGGGRH
ncbi:MFS transporter [Streptomyces sp. ML-6]|uniref:MFS transporter n=1 Tax=Streptomyces sp. ML-6 TaxID=2982693 RepID=UPI0024BF82E9|nr:MFS transporter [Streptomyces sp. ML-6]MDK0524227.1 MFS transporter [Streptomyces sp. ML-6]